MVKVFTMKVTRHTQGHLVLSLVLKERRITRKAHVKCDSKGMGKVKVFRNRQGHIVVDLSTI